MNATCPANLSTEMVIITVGILNQWISIKLWIIRRRSVYGLWQSMNKNTDITLDILWRMNLFTMAKAKMPITVLARSKAWTVSARSNSGIVGSNPTNLKKKLNSHSEGWSSNWVHSARRPLLAYCTCLGENLVEWMAGETEVLGENLPQRHFVHHEYHFTRPGLEPWPPRWEAND
jgi:hypothetical protein